MLPKPGQRTEARCLGELASLDIVSLPAGGIASVCFRACAKGLLQAPGNITTDPRSQKGYAASASQLQPVGIINRQRWTEFGFMCVISRESFAAVCLGFCLGGCLAMAWILHWLSLLQLLTAAFRRPSHRVAIAMSSITLIAAWGEAICVFICCDICVFFSGLSASFFLALLGPATLLGCSLVYLRLFFLGNLCHFVSGLGG